MVVLTWYVLCVFQNPRNVQQRWCFVTQIKELADEFGESKGEGACTSSASPRKWLKERTNLAKLSSDIHTTAVCTLPIRAHKTIHKTTDHRLVVCSVDTTLTLHSEDQGRVSSPALHKPRSSPCQCLGGEGHRQLQIGSKASLVYCL